MTDFDKFSWSFKIILEPQRKSTPDTDTSNDPDTTATIEKAAHHPVEVTCVFNCAGSKNPSFTFGDVLAEGIGDDALAKAGELEINRGILEALPSAKMLIDIKEGTAGEAVSYFFPVSGLITQKEIGCIIGSEPGMLVLAESPAMKSLTIKLVCEKPILYNEDHIKAFIPLDLKITKIFTGVSDRDEPFMPAYITLPTEKFGEEQMDTPKLVYGKNMKISLSYTFLLSKAEPKKLSDSIDSESFNFILEDQIRRKEDLVRGDDISKMFQVEEKRVEKRGQGLAKFEFQDFKRLSGAWVEATTYWEPIFLEAGNRANPYEKDGRKAYINLKWRLRSAMNICPKLPFSRIVYRLPRSSAKIWTIKKTQDAINLAVINNGLLGLIQPIDDPSSDIITAVQITDANHRLVIIEFTSDGSSMKQFFDTLKPDKRDCLLDEAVTFRERLYTKFTATLKTIKLTQKMAKFNLRPSLFKADLGTKEQKHQVALFKCTELLKTSNTKLLVAKTQNIFPTAEEILIMEKNLGGYVSDDDICGRSLREKLPWPEFHTLQEVLAEAKCVTSKDEEKKEENQFLIPEKEDTVVSTTIAARNFVQEKIEFWKLNTKSTMRKLEQEKLIEDASKAKDTFNNGGQKLNNTVAWKKEFVIAEKNGAFITYYNPEFMSSYISVEKESKVRLDYEEEEKKKAKFPIKGVDFNRWAQSKQEPYVRDALADPDTDPERCFIPYVPPNERIFPKKKEHPESPERLSDDEYETVREAVSVDHEPKFKFHLKPITRYGYTNCKTRSSIDFGPQDICVDTPTRSGLKFKKPVTTQKHTIFADAPFNDPTPNPLERYPNVGGPRWQLSTEENQPRDDMTKKRLSKAGYDADKKEHTGSLCRKSSQRGAQN